MVKSFVTLLIMAVLFLGGMLTGIHQTSTGSLINQEYPTENAGQLIHTNLDKQDAELMEKSQEESPLQVLESTREKPEAIESSHFTQKLAGALEGVMTWVYNQLIVSAYELVQVLF
ncbi:hypothetical protein [Sediminibacillus albus]|uniref:Uncharacterized protein n=1 Tax=Sediminibacillus albus TaxID=407036 RepID=A0A1G9CND3_9BACI|nr:hypothetical protein [Sediminibacillus albus]SDK53172.1 hypothetical protein SAMN05216243_3460 [Sediminibacillus albus]